MSSPVSVSTPTNPSTIPPRRIGVIFSSAKNIAARITVKIGIVEFKTPAIPESTFSSPHAINPNGTMLLITATNDTWSTSLGDNRSGSRRQATNTPIANAPKNNLPATISIGEMSSSNTFMNKNEEPQMLPITSNTARALGFVDWLLKIDTLAPGTCRG